MFWGEENDSRGGVPPLTGMDAMNQREQDKTAFALAQTEKRLYHLPSAADVDAEEEEERPEAQDEFRRFESTGYDAHTDSVEQHEIRDWQRQFVYLRVEGRACFPPCAGSSSSSSSSSSTRGLSEEVGDEEMEGVQFVPMPFKQSILPSTPSASNKMQIAHTGDHENESDRALDMGIRGSRVILRPWQTQTPPLPLSSPSPFPSSTSLSLLSSSSSLSPAADAMLTDCGDDEQGADAASSIGTGTGSGNGSDSSYINSDGEEVLAQHGILEEWIEVNHCPASRHDIDDTGSGTRERERDGEEEREEEIVTGDPVSPDLARRAEVIGILTDAIWPECVDKLRPLVERIVLEARKHGLDYSAKVIDETEDDAELSSFRDGFQGDDDSGW